MELVCMENWGVAAACISTIAGSRESEPTETHRLAGARIHQRNAQREKYFSYSKALVNKKDFLLPTKCNYQHLIKQKKKNQERTLPIHRKQQQGEWIEIFHRSKYLCKYCTLLTQTNWGNDGFYFIRVWEYVLCTC